MKTLKTHFDVVHDMLNASGFGYDEMKQCVVAEKTVWDAYLQELCIIFGKDRANGKEAATPNDVLEALEDEELDKEKEADNDDVENPLDDILIPLIVGNTSKTCSKKKRKKKSQSGEEMILEMVKSSSSFIGSKMDSSSERISRAIEDASVKDMKLKLNEELKKLSGFSMVERHRATAKLARDHDLLDIFFTIEDEEKEAWVKEVVL
ncbi:uncharacterized protein At2g29880-like [Cornus florida]|uniref:uncharacterized protein At2g29880-like n=1 Tax=Cornus florida TaxID=4283 RepID=UPI0028998750|nr:uncharacterized protein At2g29880-like [Cornus florida]